MEKIRVPFTKDLMRAAEALFYADSSAVCSMLRLAHEGDLPFDLTTSLAVLSVDELLAAVNLDVAQRLTLYTDAAPLTRAGGEEYRGRKAELRPLFAQGPRSTASSPARGRPV